MPDCIGTATANIKSKSLSVACDSEQRTPKARSESVIITREIARMESSQTLTSLAMLKVDLDHQHRNYVDYVSPFVIDVLNADRPEIISDGTVADKLLKRFGLKMPTKAVQHVLRRLQKKGHLCLEDGIFVVTPSLPASEVADTRTKALRHIDRVIDAIVEEAKCHNLSWTGEEAINAVTSFLGKFTVDCLRSYVFNTALPQIPAENPGGLYVISKFVTKAQARNEPAFESFIVLVKGLMYSNALLCPDLESLEKKFQDVTFYLDTPLVLNLLGLQGLDGKRSADELVELLKKLRGSLAVFSHTVTESQQVVAAAASNFNNLKATGKVIDEARRAGTRLSDLVLIRDTLDDRLKSMGVQTKRTPEYTLEYQVDEREFESALAEEVYYRGESALQNDINSVRSIYVLRRGRQPVRLEDAVAVFVTTNQGFAKAAFNAGRNHNSTREVSSVITAYSLSNIAWLKSPLAAPSLPIVETIAMCYAALEPSHELFKRYVQEMDKLLMAGQISPRDHEILRLSPSAREELMELTLGDEHALTVTSIKNILANAKASIISEVEASHQVQMQELVSRGEAKLTDARDRERQLQQKVENAETAANAATAAVKALNEQIQRRSASQMSRARRIARMVTIGVVMCSMVVLLLGALLGSGLVSAASDDSPAWRLFLSGLTLLAVVWGVYSWHTGKSVRQVGQALEDRLARWLGSLLGAEH